MHDQPDLLERPITCANSVPNGLLHKTGLTPSDEEKFISLCKIFHRPNSKALFYRHSERGHFKPDSLVGLLLGLLRKFGHLFSNEIKEAL